MLKRFKPLELPDGIRTSFQLPLDYIGGTVNVYINGVLYVTENDVDSPYGFILNSNNNSFDFYQPLHSEDSLYIMYDSDGAAQTIDLNNVDWTKTVRKTNFNAVNTFTNNFSTKKTQVIPWSVKTTIQTWSQSKQKSLFTRDIKLVTFSYKTCNK